ncbi:hypothetical protein H5W18_10780 [Lactobacillus sp. Marseille-P7033]|nr:hypothetical protein [Lactobacillus sp. Marseille-P7033]NGC78956.1 hypothetical protein [Limosilactobacillus reuteri]
MTNSEHYAGKHLTIDVLPTNQVHQAQTLDNLLQAQTEANPLPINPNTKLIKQLHNKLPITNWAWKRKKQYDYKVEVNKENQHSTQQQQAINYPTHPKQPDNILEP